jgi:arthrofactin-type cyclic lipopeptide synthetase B
MYGTTETTGIVATYEIPDEIDPGSPVPIGRPIDAVSCVLLDEDRRVAADGVEGHLHVCGATVTRGYLDQPELTARAFVDLPESHDPAYATGDICRRRSDGVLEYVGRRDREIKTRGFRVHPSEIERVLQAQPAVEQAAVSGDDSHGDTRIVAYVVAAQPGTVLDPTVLRRVVRDELPEHMVPSHFVQLEALPLTPNRKIDRRELPPADGDRRLVASDDFHSPTERRVAALWAESLGVSRVGASAGFFELGGNSLLAIDLVCRLFDEFGVTLPASIVADTPTVALMAARVDAARTQDSHLAGERHPLPALS